MRIAVLASGGLGATLLKSEVFKRYEIVAVFTDKKSSDIQNFSSEHNIPTFLGNPRNGKAKTFIEGKHVDVLVSINYLFIIDSDLIKWPRKLSFNIHGSLLPKYRGRTPHVWAIINNEEVTGITAHTIDDDCDTGDIIEQIEIPINPETTGGELLKKFEFEYPLLIGKVLEDIKNETLTLTKQDHSKATFYGKRTPASGRIDWSWQRERIKNWVRAQSEPYPGAFTFLNDQKIVIDNVSFDDYGFEYDMPNGLILTGNPIRIKTANGAIRLVKVRNLDFEIKKGKVLQ